MADISGTEGDNVLYDTSGDDTISAYGGDDTIYVHSGYDIVGGGNGSDRLVIDYSADTSGIGGGLGMDPTGIQPSGYSSQAHNSNGAPLFGVSFTGVEHFTITTGSGDDYIATWSGNDVVRVGAGNDQVDVGTGLVTADGGSGTDVLFADWRTVTEAIVWNLQTNSFSGAAGMSVINFEQVGGVYVGGAPSGGYLWTGSGNDVIVTSDLALNDRMNLGAGNDTAHVFGGFDRVEGGSGTDMLVVDYSSVSSGVYVSGYFYDDADGGYTGQVYARLNGTADAVSSVDFLSIENFRIIAGKGDDSLALGDGDDQIEGRAGNDTLNGGGGADMLYGNSGDDTLVGGAGDDRLDGGAGIDSLSGGTGDDIYVVDSLGDTITETAAAGKDTVESKISWTLGLNLEKLTLLGSADNDGTGNEVNNVIQGNRGDNVLSGLAKHDTLYGMAGNDTLLGGNGSDFLFGGSGNDTLIGGRGRDVFHGGKDADEFVFNDGDFAGLAVNTSDKIKDFNSGQGDTINLAGVDANKLVTGDQAFDFIGTGAFSNSAGELRYEIVSGNTYVYGDTDGDGLADFMILLTGSHALVQGDFVI